MVPDIHPNDLDEIATILDKVGPRLALPEFAELDLEFCGRKMAQPSTLTVIPRLVDLVADPGKVALLPLETIAGLRGELTKLDTLLLGRLFSEAKGRREAGTESDRLLNAKEAAAMLHTTAGLKNTSA